MERLCGRTALYGDGINNAVYSNYSHAVIQDDFGIAVRVNIESAGTILEKENEYILKCDENKIQFGIYNSTLGDYNYLDYNENIVTSEWNNIFIRISSGVKYIYLNNVTNVVSDVVLEIPASTTNFLTIFGDIIARIDDIKIYIFDVGDSIITDILDDKLYKYGMELWNNFEEINRVDDYIYNVNNDEYFETILPLGNGKENDLYNRFIANEHIY